jgi:hypothetical protein
MEKSRLGFLLEINFKTKNFWGIFYFIAFELFYVSLRGKTFHQFMVESALKFNLDNLFLPINLQFLSHY